MTHSFDLSKWLARAALLALAVILGACVGAPSDPSGEAAPAGAPIHAAQAVAARPAGVPDEFVHTPSGYFHPSCVIEVAQDERVRKDGVIERADGSIRTLPGCAHPSYDKRGREMKRTAADAPKEPFIHDWVVSSDNNTHGNLQYIQAEWTVPSNPYLASNQVLFYFPGLQDSQSIVQPVLQYNQPGSPGWTISSWFCCLNGYTWHSPFVNVNVGDTIFGAVSGSFACTGPLGCGEWTITTWDFTRGVSTQLVTGIYFSGDQDAVGGALEAYNISFCSEFSAQSSVTFSSIAVETTAGTWPSMSWPQRTTGDLPQCLYSESSTGSNNVTLTVGQHF